MKSDEFQLLSQEIGESFLRAAPTGWVAGRMEFRQVGKTGEFEALVSVEEDLEVRISLDRGASQSFRQMRKMMAEPGKGAWFSVTCRLRAPGHMSFDFDYDNEPTWSTPTSVGHYLEEWEKYPRDAESTPAWLKQRLEEAKEWSEAGR